MTLAVDGHAPVVWAERLDDLATASAATPVQGRPEGDRDVQYAIGWAGRVVLNRPLRSLVQCWRAAPQKTLNEPVCTQVCGWFVVVHWLSRVART